MKKYFIILIVVLAVLTIIFVGGFVFLCLLMPVLSQKGTEEDFSKNRDNIIIVTNYLVNSKYESIIITTSDFDGTMYVNLDGDIAIEDQQVLEALDELLKPNNYKTIGRYKNAIDFIRSSTLDFSSGIVYSMDGNDPQLQFLTRLEPLSEPNWYYFEEDFNLWREREERKKAGK